MKKFADILASAVSYILIPPGMLLILFIYLGIKNNSQIVIVYISVSLGFFIPVLYFAIQRFRGKIVDNDASNKNERTIPYLIGAFLCSIAIMFCYLLNADRVIFLSWISYLSLLLIMLPINIFWKISAHAIGVAIPLAIFLNITNYSFLGALSLLLIIGWARYQLKQHNLTQILAGSILGFFVPTLIFYLF